MYTDITHIFHCPTSEFDRNEKMILVHAYNAYVHFCRRNNEDSVYTLNIKRYTKYMCMQKRDKLL